MHLNSSSSPKILSYPSSLFSFIDFPFRDTRKLHYVYSIPDTAASNRNLILNFLSGLVRPVVARRKFATKDSLTLWRVDPDERGEWKRQCLQTPLIFRSFPLQKKEKSKKKRVEGAGSKNRGPITRSWKTMTQSARRARYSPLSQRDYPQSIEKVASSGPFQSFVSITTDLIERSLTEPCIETPITRIVV